MSRIQDPQMDPWEFIDDGYSRLDHMDGLGRQPDLEALNLHDAAEYRARHARAAHPHYRRHGEVDAVTGEWVPFTADELADMKAARTERRAIIGLSTLIVACGVIAVVIGLAARAGLL